MKNLLKFSFLIILFLAGVLLAGAEIDNILSNVDRIFLFIFLKVIALVIIYESTRLMIRDKSGLESFIDRLKL